MSKLVAGSRALVIPVDLAAEVGLNEALFLQQVHYMIESKLGEVHRGQRWIFNTFEQWAEVFPFWSKRTIERIVKKLRESELLLVDDFNRSKSKHTNWYTINYELLEQSYPQLFDTCSQPCQDDDAEPRQNDEHSDRQNGEIMSLDLLSLNTITENNTYTNSVCIDDTVLDDLIDFWNNHGTIQHSKLSPKMLNRIKRALAKALSYCSIDDIKDAIVTYAVMYDLDEYYLSFKTTLLTFLERHLDTFLDADAARELFLTREARAMLYRIKNAS